MIKARPWSGKDLKGTWEVTLKIDGVRALKTVAGTWVSRNGKPLYNIPKGYPNLKDVEVYLGPEHGDQKARFAATIRAVRTPKPKLLGCKLKKCRCPHEGAPIGEPAPCKNWVEATPPVLPEHLYSLDPLDSRLGCNTVRQVLGEPLVKGPNVPYTMRDPDKQDIQIAMERAVEAGYEGLVLRYVPMGNGPVIPEVTWLKVKPIETYDVRILSVHEGVGKRKGHVGYFMTAKGKVGGFKGTSYAQLKDWWEQHTAAVERGTLSLVGQTIEVECLHLTPDGKFRLPRFVRFRPDKDADE